MTADRAAAVTGCSLVALGRFDEPRGSLCVVEVGRHVNLEIKRAYWIFDVPPGGKRAHHAQREQTELLVAARGSFDVHCDDGHVRESWTLDSPHTGLLVPPMVFHSLDEFSPGSLCLAFATGSYEIAEYVIDYDDFRELVNRR